MSEKEWIDKIKKKDKTAIKELYLHYSPVMLAIGMRYCGNRDDAKDVMQDCFIKIITRISTFSATGNFEGWMKRIMINASIDFYKQKRKHEHFEIEEKYLDSEEKDSFDDVPEKGDKEKPSLDLVVKADFTKEEIVDCVYNIPDPYRIIFNLFVLENYSHLEIAEKLGIDPNASRVGLFRAKEMIRKILHQKSVERLTK